MRLAFCFRLRFHDEEQNKRASGFRPRGQAFVSMQREESEDEERGEGRDPVLTLAIFGVSAASSSAQTMEPASEIWHPAPGVTWQWQLTGSKVDTYFDVDVYDIDSLVLQL